MEKRKEYILVWGQFKKQEIVEKWSLEWGFKFSISKTCYQIFTKKKSKENKQLKLYGVSLEKVSKFKYLGMWFDNKLTWKDHIDYIFKKCSKVLNLMRGVAGQDWGADKQSLKGIYGGLM